MTTQPIYVLADDITGAAEIAGIAHRYGLRTKVCIDRADADIADVDVTVIATDARSYGPDEATRMMKDALLSLPQENAILFHKVDSALRGNVQSQLNTLPFGEGRGGVLYMPANPSKGRIIKDGVYYINGTEISQTDFRFDPEFPAWSSRVEERFPGIRYANAETSADVRRVARQALAEGLVLAGAADLFEALLMITHQLSDGIASPHGPLAIPSGKTIIVCGSTQSKPLNIGLPIYTMPLDVFYEKAKPVTWSATILSRTIADEGLILTIGDKEVRQGKSAAVYLRNAMAEVTCTLAEAIHPNSIIVEGGATAFAILSNLPYTVFNVMKEIAPGVVHLQTNDGLSVILKPGSYSWQ